VGGDPADAACPELVDALLQTERRRGTGFGGILLLLLLLLFVLLPLFFVN